MSSRSTGQQSGVTARSLGRAFSALESAGCDAVVPAQDVKLFAMGIARELRAKFEEVAAVVRDCAEIEKVVIFEPDGLSEANALSLAELEERGSALETEQPNLSAELARASSAATSAANPAVPGSDRGKRW